MPPPGRTGDAGGLASRLLGLPDALFDDFWGTLKRWQDRRALWLCGGLSALALELFSLLYFQRHLRLSPCEYCVLIRFAMATVFLGGMIGSIRPSSPLFKLPGLAVSIAGAAMGLRWCFVLEGINVHAAMNPDFMAPCSSGRVSFPLGLPLDRWLPGHFSPGGVCGVESQWEFWGMNMPQWLIMICLVYLAGLVLMGVANFLPRRPGAGGGP
ncbi:MAG: disulfide bond formation protein B [Deltaproteobacteria bacterium]|jgi:disulfide bond formation protein DsbB|nr:disulfide bond formation protein B [Deltaproteobacteria bacterium]